MDVHCLTCGEPWAVWHLQQELIHEVSADSAEANTWLRLPVFQRLSSSYRERFRIAGWEFGALILDVRRCPCCPREARPDPKKTVLRSVIIEVLGNDEDAIATTFEDLGL